MPKRVDDAGALFKPFWREADGFREFNREVEADQAENRWPLLKSMPIDKPFKMPALSRRQKEGWSDRDTIGFAGHSTEVSLLRVFRRIEHAVEIGAKVRR